MQAEMHAWHLANEFKRELGADKVLPNGSVFKIGDVCVHNLILLTIDDLENLESSIENFSLMELFRDYSAACPDRTCSFHNFIANSKYGTMMFANRSLAENALETLRDVKEQAGFEDE